MELALFFYVNVHNLIWSRKLFQYVTRYLLKNNEKHCKIICFPRENNSCSLRVINNVYINLLTRFYLKKTDLTGWQ